MGDLGAVSIQRMWRGSHSRRRIHSFYDRKRYLASVLNVGETLRQNMVIHHDNLSQTELLEKVRRESRWKSIVILVSHT